MNFSGERGPDTRPRIENAVHLDEKEQYKFLAALSVSVAFDIEQHGKYLELTKEQEAIKQSIESIGFIREHATTELASKLIVELEKEFDPEKGFFTQTEQFQFLMSKMRTEYKRSIVRKHIALGAEYRHPYTKTNHRFGVNLKKTYENIRFNEDYSGGVMLKVPGWYDVRRTLDERYDGATKRKDSEDLRLEEFGDIAFGREVFMEKKEWMKEVAHTLVAGLIDASVLLSKERIPGCSSDKFAMRAMSDLFRVTLIFENSKIPKMAGGLGYESGEKGSYIYERPHGDYKSGYKVISQLGGEVSLVELFEQTHGGKRIFDYVIRTLAADKLLITNSQVVGVEKASGGGVAKRHLVDNSM